MPDSPQVLPQVLPQFSEIWQQTLGWQPTETQYTQFQQLYEQILEGNRQLNLTRITAPDEFWEKHLWDSLLGIKPWLSGNIQSDNIQSSKLRVLDIGTGAGFPGIPVAIAHPDWQVTLLDSTQKKMLFVDGLVATLNLTNAQTHTDRAEQLKKNPQHQEQYDLVLIRAVATAIACAKYSLPLLQVGGTAVLYRGQWEEKEAIALESAVKKLGGEIAEVEAVTTPLSHGVRHCVYLKKMSTTQKDPVAKPLRRA
jgi:16S rRNA (guanine527-N7)-methyltransferase